MLVDSNILLDIATNDPAWGDWSAGALAKVAENSPLIINPIIDAEVSISFTSIEALDAALSAALYQREALPWEAGSWRGSVRAVLPARGVRSSPLPDFYIGAHAAIGALALLTRDAARYRSYFPKLEILAPGR